MLDELKHAITEEITNIDGEIVQWAINNFRERLRECTARDEKHIKDIIFKK